MARPKYTIGENNAKEKIAAAFWQLLAEKPYTKISVAEICKTAELNKNTFYYHYETLDHLAVSLVHQTLDKRFALFLLSSEPDKVMPKSLINLDVSDHFKHICLIAGKNSSPMLISVLKESLTEIWREVLYLDDKSFTKELQILFEFALGGILSVMALNNKENNYSYVSILEMAELDFVKTLLATIKQMVH